MENKKNSYKLDHHDADVENTPKTSKAKGTKNTIIETKSGKTIEVIEKQINASLSNISIQPFGFSEINEIIKMEETDPVSTVIYADLDQNNYDELYIVTKSAGSGSYATIYGYGSHNDKSLIPIIVPQIAQSDLASDAIFYGYRGHDSIYVIKHQLARKFPVYKDQDENCCPTGGKKIIKYNLIADEVSWRLELID